MTNIRIHKGGEAITDIGSWYDLAPPKKRERHWKDNYSAKEFARSFFPQAGGDELPFLPPELEALLLSRFSPPFEVEGEPEHVVVIDALRGNTRTSISLQW